MGSLTPRDLQEVRETGRLSLAGRNLTSVPDEVFTLTNLVELDLSRNKLTSLPPEIGRLTWLQEISLTGNELITLPPQLGKLSHLRVIGLNDNNVRSLPSQLSALSQLQVLMLTGNVLESLPPVVPRLTSLRSVWLDGNQLAALPAAIGGLTRLRQLRIGSNKLTTLPSAIGKLANLTALRLDGNQVTHVPPEIQFLGNLRLLRLDRNKLSRFPLEITELSSLRDLWLDDNEITEVPPEIARLTDLHTLSLARNKLTSVPAEIAGLAKLRELRVDDNQLTELPKEFAVPVARGLILDVRGNPLRTPLPEVTERGPAAVAAYLRSLERASLQFEAKVLLLGEGDVGKTSLAAALRGEEFVDRRPSTPGIEISSLTLPHPERPGEEMTLRLWDFGGQEDYRITHQLFISPRALYLVVWYPRAGWAGANVEAWLRGILLRIGRGQPAGSARVLIVATHSSDTRSSVDYPRLERAFPGILAGHYEVDSRTGAGLPELRDAIAREAATLPQMGLSIGEHWAAARRDILELAETQAHIPFRQFTEICDRNEVIGEDVTALAGLMHDLGQIVYYGDDQELRDIVVLNPEWLTRAISDVLTDGPTRNADGVLDHARLPEIWHDRADGPGYRPGQFPFFLRLMEKFDVSYRLENEDKSLVAQLVPYARPDLPWYPDTPLESGVRTLTLRCLLGEAAPGLIAWLTVRLHRSSTGRHWRDGVFLRYWIRAYSSEALLELLNDRELAIEVRAPSPDYFFDVLVDSIHHLITLRWPGLEYEFLVPCPTRDAHGTPCNGDFPLEFLLHCREEDISDTLCHACRKKLDVDRLLTGFPRQRPLQADLEPVLDELRGMMRRLEELAVRAANYLRQLLAAANAEVTDCPHLFTLTPDSRRHVGALERHYRLVLWCEYPGGAHPLPDKAYSLGQPREWFRRIGPYAALMLSILKIVVPIAGAVGGAVLPGTQLDRVRVDLDVMQELMAEAGPLADVPSGTDGWANGDVQVGPLTRAEGEALRALRQILFEHDRAHRFGGLRRWLTVTGDYLWLCPEHYAEYDPGLPRILPPGH